ncbi:MAG: hypothetical protein WKG06_03025 [Segetibacter sp.]
MVDELSEKFYICEKVTVPIYENSKINLDDLDLFIKDPESKKKFKIRGWLALMKSAGSGTGKWGIHLFKNNQIIERYHQLPIRLGASCPKIHIQFTVEPMEKFIWICVDLHFTK